MALLANTTYTEATRLMVEENCPEGVACEARLAKTMNFRYSANNSSNIKDLYNNWAIKNKRFIVEEKEDETKPNDDEETNPKKDDNLPWIT
jgi:hypothetical protein